MSRQLKTEIVAWLLMISGLGTILLFMGSIFYILIAQSIGFYNLSGESHFSLSYWYNMLANVTLQKSMLYTFKVSFIGALGAVILSYPIALWLHKPLPMKEGIIAILRIPMFVPGLVAAFLFINLISYHGILNGILLMIGLIERPLRLQNDHYGIGVIILQVWKNMPFALILVSGSLNSIKRDMFDASNNLGASKWKTFVNVVIPLTLPAVQVALILVFIRAMGDFAFASIAGPQTTYSMGQVMQFTAMKYSEWNNSAVVAVLIMIIIAIFTIVSTLIITPFATRKGELK